MDACLRPPPGARRVRRRRRVPRACGAFNAKLAHVFADARAGLNDGLMQLVFYLLRDVRRSRRDELANVRTQFARRGINDLELFLDADSEAVSHGLGPLDLLVLSGTSKFVSYRDAAQNTPMPRACRATICFERKRADRNVCPTGDLLGWTVPYLTA